MPRTSRGSYAYVVERPARVGPHGRAPPGRALRSAGGVGHACTSRGRGRRSSSGQEFLRTALHGDVVEVVPFAGRIAGVARTMNAARGRSSGLCGEGRKPLSARYGSRDSSLFLVPDNPRIGRDISSVRMMPSAGSGGEGRATAPPLGG